MNSELETIVISNANAISALTTALAQEREERKKSYAEWEKDRHRLYQYLGHVASAQSHFYEVQSDYYEQLAILSNKQTQLEEKQTQLEERQVEMQQQIAELLSHLSSQS